jgi:hypothetical protein
MRSRDSFARTPLRTSFSASASRLDSGAEENDPKIDAR